jgi:hypothetical protein
MVSWITSRGTSRKRGIETAEQRHRPFGKAGIFRQQAFILDQRKACGCGGGSSAFGDDAAALYWIEDHVAGAQLFGIIVGAADGDDPGMVEAVPDRGCARADAGNLQLHDLFAEQGDDPWRGGPSADFRWRRKQRPSASTWARERLGRRRGSLRQGQRMWLGRACRSRRTGYRRDRPAARG